MESFLITFWRAISGNIIGLLSRDHFLKHPMFDRATKEALDGSPKEAPNYKENLQAAKSETQRIVELAQQHWSIVIYSLPIDIVLYYKI
ncbi:MAG: hypothetical protein KDD53_09900, partial [Bdellovibrionales bacterium]|nr:hypothetical protein [Bdellovibrionales bacterium]